MNLLVLSINYIPEQTGFGPHVAALCEYLMCCKHQVTVLTGFPFAPHWQRWPEYNGKFIDREKINEVDVVRLTHYIPRAPGKLLGRLLLEGSFSIMAAGAGLALAQHRWDGVLYVGAQPSIAMTARWLAWVLRVPYIINIQDLASQAAAGVGIVRSARLARWLERFEFSAYARAAGALVLCQAFQDALVAHRYPAEQIRLVRSPIDLRNIRPVTPDGVFRRNLGIALTDFVVLFAGSMGLKQALPNIVEAARLIRTEAPLIKWVLVGEGESKAATLDLIRYYDLESQVLLLPLQPSDQMANMLASADVLLLNQLSSVKDTVIPSKLLTYMAAGRAVVAAVNEMSQSAILMREAQGGVWVESENPAALATAIRNLQYDPSGLPEMGRRNRRFAEEHFDQKLIVQAQEAFLLQVVGQLRPISGGL
jgi:colanic acid biosynthesis glycosyl transferase WcaI